MSFYKLLLKPILFQLDPERAHDVMVAFGEWFGRFDVSRALVRGIYGYRGPDISKTVDGIVYRTPFLLSAGLDYNGRLTRILPSIGLGGEEVGSVTARVCEGNPKPRLTRLIRSQSILVNKGLRNDGVDAIIRRLQSCPREKEYVIGISIARTNDKQAASIEDGIADYVYSLQQLVHAGVGDYYTINISCPNASGGETFTTSELLGALLSELKTIQHSKPMYIKMPINIPWHLFEKLLTIIDEFGLSGVVIGNVNKDYTSLTHRDEAPEKYVGGLSGKPCQQLSTELIQKTRERFGNRFTIIGCGGVLSPELALEKFDAGADLVQMITGLIFEGPSLVKRSCCAYAQRLG
ncbi:MAG: quinone-dependent dihydroorotate dehydrogenase [Candidatus Campbellbacteria bacterium]|nr:quinone-dependent dihydroorotate dehydrogenase [Candidatus Campbellbacteria bacterium]